MDIKFEGLDEIMVGIEKFYNEVEERNIDKKILKKCGEITIPVLKRNTPKSKDNKKSGRKGYRPNGHLADNIPTRVVRKQEGYYYMLVGWGKIGRHTNWFYAKYLEWGTSKIPPVAMFGTTQAELEPQYDEIAKEEYEKALKEVLEI